MKLNKIDFKSPGIRISIISIIINVVLSAIKLLAGIVGHSQALIADAVHSISDVLSTIIVIAALVIAGKKPDRNHPYGHQKFESLAALFLAIFLGYVGVEIGITGVTSIVNKTYLTLPVPTLFTAIAAFISIVVKELMFQATIRVAKKENSNALKADAWHHRSDALSSIGSLAGVIFAMAGVPIMDAIASLIICIFIIKTALEILVDEVKALTDAACDLEKEDEIRKSAEEVEGVIAIDILKTRISGSGIYVDMEIEVDGSLPLSSAHDIAESVHDVIEESFPEVWHCMVHVNPNK